MILKPVWKSNSESSAVAETRRENLIYAQVETAGAALRAMRFAPLLHLDVGPLGTLDIRVPPA